MTALDGALPPGRPAAPRRPRWTTDSPAMAAAAVLWAATVPAYATLALAVPDTIAGEAAWLKPLRFAASTALWAATLAWAARYLPEGLRRARWFRAYGWTVFAAMLAEMAWITTASALVQKAHYNTEVAWLAAAYPVAGLVATWFAGSALVWGVALLRTSGAAAPRPIVWTLGLAMVATTLLTIVTAFALAGVEPPDTGLPLLGWTFGAGDLRPAHFAATHAMQVVPAAAVVLGVATRGGGAALALGWAAVTGGLLALGLGLL